MAMVVAEQNISLSVECTAVLNHVLCLTLSPSLCRVKVQHLHSSSVQVPEQFKAIQAYLNMLATHQHFDHNQIGLKTSKLF